MAEQRVTQVTADVSALSSTSNAIVTQLVTESSALRTLTAANALVTQIAVEVLCVLPFAGGEECSEAWTIPTPTAYPLPAAGGPQFVNFDEIAPDWGEFGHQFGDGKARFATMQSARVRRFTIEYDGLSSSDAATLDAHWESTRGALKFTITHPRTAEVVTGVRYQEYTRSPHERYWSQARSVKLVRYTNG